jgi:ABC-type nitrate/sulfonate/bicarbonate transport system substrate-binding protein
VPLWLGVDLGLFRKYGLNVEPILFRVGAESTHALTGGEIQFDVVAPQPHIAASLSGADIIIIGTYSTNTPTASPPVLIFARRRICAARQSACSRLSV